MRLDEAASSTPARYRPRRQRDENAAIVEALEDGVVITGADMRVTDVSARFCELTGFDSVELVGASPPFPWWPREELEALAAALHSTATSDDRRQVDTVIQRRDGSRLPARLTTAALRDDGGSIYAHVTTFEDITERYRRELALHDAEEQFRLAFDDAPIGMAITSLKGAFIRTNRAFADMVGYGADELAGTRVTGLTHNDDRQTDATQRQALVDGTLTVDRRRKRYLGAHGRLVHVDITERLVRDDNGRPLYVVAHLVDVTAQLAAEAAQGAAERRFQTLSEQAPVGIFQTDASGAFVWVNETWQALAGLHMADAIGAGWAAALHRDDRGRVLQAWEAATTSGGDFRLEYRLVSPDGTIRSVQASARALADEADETSGYLGTVTDISARVADEARLRDLTERLAASEHHYRLLAENSSDLVMRVSVDGAIAYASPASEALLSLRPGELVGRSIQGMIAPADLADLAARRDRTDAAAPDTVTIEARLAHADGYWVWCEATVRAIRAPDTGTTVEYQASIRSVDERKSAEATIRRSVEQYRALARSIPSGFVLLFDTDLRFLIAEGEGLADLGYNAGSFEGRTPRETLPADVATGVEERYRRALAGEQSEWERERDGRLFRLVVGPVRDDAGAIFAGVVVALDITAQRQAEADVRARERRFRTALDASLDNFCIMDAIRDGAGRIVDFELREANARFATLVAKDRVDLIGSRYCDLSPNSASFLGRYIAAVESGQPLEEEVRAADGRWFAHQIVPLGDGVAFTSRDVSERRRSDQRLQEREAEQAALRDVATAVAQGDGTATVFRLVAQHVTTLLGVGGTAVVRFDTDERGTLLAVTPERPPAFLEGAQIPLSRATAAGRVLATGRAQLVQAYDAASLDLFAASGVSSGAAAPIRVAGRLWGALAAVAPDSSQLDESTLDRLGRFADIVSIAVANTETAHKDAAPGTPTSASKGLPPTA